MKRQGDKRRGHRLSYRINGREGLNWLQTTAEAVFQSLILRFLPPIPPSLAPSFPPSLPHPLTPAAAARPQTFKKKAPFESTASIFSALFESNPADSRMSKLKNAEQPMELHGPARRRRRRINGPISIFNI